MTKHRFHPSIPHTLLFALGVVMTAFPAPVLAQEEHTPAEGMMTMEELLAYIGENAAVANTWSGDVEMSVDLGGQSMRYAGTMFGKGTYLYSLLNMNMGGQTMSLLTVIDPNNVQWSETSIGGVKRVMKIDLNEVGEEMLSKPDMGGLGIMGAGSSLSMTQDPREMLESYGQMYHLGTESVTEMDGTEVYVIHGRIRDAFKDSVNPQGAMQQLGASLEDIHIIVGKSDGFVRQLEFLGKDGKPFVTTRYRNVKINNAVDESRFVYSPPKGAPVQDLTEQIKGNE